jgi:hypothetical protein
MAYVIRRRKLRHRADVPTRCGLCNESRRRQGEHGGYRRHETVATAAARNYALSVYKLSRLSL